MVCLIVTYPSPGGPGSVGALVDPFERLLADYVARIKAAWVKAEATSPLGEFTAEAAALLQFYREQQGKVCTDCLVPLSRPHHPNCAAAREPRPSPKGSGRDDTGWGKHWSDE